MAKHVAALGVHRAGRRRRSVDAAHRRPPQTLGPGEPDGATIYRGSCELRDSTWPPPPPLASMAQIWFAKEAGSWCIFFLKIIDYHLRVINICINKNFIRGSWSQHPSLYTPLTSVTRKLISFVRTMIVQRLVLLSSTRVLSLTITCCCYSPAVHFIVLTNIPMEF